MISYKLLSAEGEARLREVTENAAEEALQLLLYATGMDRTAYLLRREDAAVREQAEAYRRLVAERAQGEPLQYLMRSQDFLGHTFAVGPGVLIPRPETEELALLCIQKIRDRGYRRVFDLCAGTGCIGVSIALKCPQTEVWLFEKDEPAIGYLKRNIPASAAGRAHLIQADILNAPAKALPQPDLIVSNPPYIPTCEIPGLQREVLREPATALDGGDDGLAFYRAILRHWTPLLPVGGFAAFECGEDQADILCTMFSHVGNARKERDAFGADRFVTIEK